MNTRIRVPRALLVSALLLTAACGSGGKSTPPPACERSCRDDVALRALRTMLKLAYNATVAGRPVGAQDASFPCPYGAGSVHVYGTATSNNQQGSTFIGDITKTPPEPLIYEFDGCRYLQRDAESDQNFDMVLDGSVGELGTLAQQPTATTALAFTGTDLHLYGSVYDPAYAYDERWNFASVQNGNDVGACICTPVGDGGSPSGVDAGIECGVDAGNDCRTAAFNF